MGKKLEEKFKDVDDFISYSLSVQNRRKARAGYALENHLQEIFRAVGVVFERGAKLEAKAKPDFLFPGKGQYFDETFPVSLLTLLGAKTSCKDRWRQVLAEGSKVKEKYLVTLEPGISTDQLNEMRSKNLQLVVPEDLHESYPCEERLQLWSLENFIDFVLTKQKTADIPLDYSDKTRLSRQRKTS